MYIIVGLGNPGKQFDNTRHNAGFDALSILAQTHGISLTRLKHQALCGEGTVAGEKVLLAFPQTYMNESGQAVRALCEFYKIEHNKLIVLYDDIDLALGRLRIRERGSAGTHNGMRSIIYQLGYDDFCRVRIGIGRPERIDLKDFVLQKIPKTDWEIAFDSYKRASEAVEMIISRGTQAAMGEYNKAEAKNADPSARAEPEK